MRTLAPKSLWSAGGRLASAPRRKRFLEKFAQGPANYAFSFVADGGAAIFFFVWALRAGSRHPWAMVAAGLAGFVLWGFSEYAFHRWVYHRVRGIFSEGHALHHGDTRAYVAMPWFLTTLAVFALWYAFAKAPHFPGFSAFLAGWLAGFVHYSAVHHAHHHWNLRGAWMRRLRAYHRVHHRFPDRNFGVTIRFWDDVFGTRFHGPADAGKVREENQTEK